MYCCKDANDSGFSTRSAYAISKKNSLLSNNLGEPSTRKPVVNFWKFPWKTLIATKIKLFLWRAYQNGIPIGYELAKRLGARETRQRLYNYEMKCSIHIFKDCWWFKALWAEAGLSTHHLEFQFSTSADWIIYPSQKLDSKEFQLVSCLMWLVWYNRNLKWHGEVGMEIQDILQKTRIYLARVHRSKPVY